MNWLGVGEDIRALHGKRAEWAQGVWRVLQTEDAQHVLRNIKLLRRCFEPEVVAEEEASRSRRATVSKVAYKGRGDDAPLLSPLP